MTAGGDGGIIFAKRDVDGPPPSVYIRNDGKTISEEGRDVGWLVGCMAYYLSCAGKVGYLLWCLILSPCVYRTWRCCYEF